MISPNLTPNPDWWISVFYKQFVSEKVLQLQTRNNFGYVRLYAHCTPEALLDEDSAITLYGMNIDKISAHVDIPDLFVQIKSNYFVSKKILYYALTADHLQSSEIKVNGKLLELQPDGSLPPFEPEINDPYTPIILPPYSMVFIIIYGVDVPACSPTRPKNDSF